MVGSFSREQLSTNLFEIGLYKIWDARGFKNAQTPDGSGFGSLAAAIGLPALLALLLVDRRARPAIFVTAASLLILLAGVKDDQYNGRFLGFFAIVSVTAVALVSTRLARGAGRTLWMTLTVCAACWSLAEGVRHAVPHVAWMYWAEHGPVVMPFRAGIDRRVAHLFEGEPRVPNGVEVVLVSPIRVAPVAVLRGDPPRRRFIDHHGPVTLETATQWRRRGVAYICVVTEPPDVASHTALLAQAGYKHLGGGWYEAN
jgi:hypothetical protein